MPHSDVDDFIYLNDTNRRISYVFNPLFESLSRLDKKGLDKNILENMEISKIKDVDKLDNDKKQCMICLENYINGDESIALPCIHIFHANCIKTWLKDNKSCPICKYEIKYDAEELDVEGLKI